CRKASRRATCVSMPPTSRSLRACRRTGWTRSLRRCYRQASRRRWRARPKRGRSSAGLLPDERHRAPPRVVRRLLVVALHAREGRLDPVGAVERMYDGGVVLDVIAFLVLVQLRKELGVRPRVHAVVLRRED